MNSCGSRSPSDAFGPIRQAALGGAAVARFVVLQAEVRRVIAQREQEVIVAIVPRTEKRIRFGYELMRCVSSPASSQARPRCPPHVHFVPGSHRGESTARKKRPAITGESTSVSSETG